MARMRCEVGLLGPLTYCGGRRGFGFPVPLVLVSLLLLGGCGATAGLGSGVGAQEQAAEVWPCNSEKYAFAVFSDNYPGQEGGLRRMLADFAKLEPNIRFIVSAGDTPTYERVRRTIDQSGWQAACSAGTAPWYPIAGNHDAELPANMAWWAENWAADRQAGDGTWESAASASPLAKQAREIENFRRGPVHVTGRGEKGALVDLPVDAGTIYSFDFRNAHFVFLNSYEQRVIRDGMAGVWDVDPKHDPDSSQLAWVKADLEQSDRPLVFLFGHVALAAPCYNREPPNPNFPCNGPAPPGWNEHNSDFHNAELVKTLSGSGAMVYFFGHDHVPSRSLLNHDRTVAYEKKFWEAAEAFGTNSVVPEAGEALQGPGRIWQVDSGLVYTKMGSYVIVRVLENDVEVATYRYAHPTYQAPGDVLSPGATVLWDSWRIPKRAFCLHRGADCP